MACAPARPREGAANGGGAALAPYRHGRVPPAVARARARCEVERLAKANAALF